MNPGAYVRANLAKLLLVRSAVCVSVVLVTATFGAVAAETEEFQPERLKDGTTLPAGMQRLYVADFSIAHLMDSRVRILDAKTGRYAGVIDSGYTGQFTTSPDGRSGYVVATYLSRHSHGQRNDVLEIVDLNTLRLQGEIILPTKHAQAIFVRELLRTSSDGKYVYLQNATPATSVTVVDVEQRKVLAEIPTPGCWALYPSQTTTLRFSALCGDGTLSTITLNADGSVQKRSAGTRFFDVEKDPVFVNTVDDGENYYFLSYQGLLTRANLSGETPVMESSRELVTAADRKKGWRPGGYQMIALHRTTDQLFIGMHPHGGEGSHKTPAREIWEFNIKSGKRVNRYKASNAAVLAVNQDEPGTLYAVDGLTNQIHAYDTLHHFKKLYVSDAAGDAVTQLDAP